MNRKEDRHPLTKVAIWWMKNYEECVHFWIGFNWIAAMAIFIIGALKGCNLNMVLGLIFIVSIILNFGLLCAIRTIKGHLLSLERGEPGRNRVHELMIRMILRRIAAYDKHGPKKKKK